MLMGMQKIRGRTFVQKGLFLISIWLKVEEVM
jgi:hypothetical protein